MITSQIFYADPGWNEGPRQARYTEDPNRENADPVVVVRSDPLTTLLEGQEIVQPHCKPGTPAKQRSTFIVTGLGTSGLFHVCWCLNLRQYLLIYSHHWDEGSPPENRWDGLPVAAKVVLSIATLSGSPFTEGEPPRITAYGNTGFAVEKAYWSRTEGIHAAPIGDVLLDDLTWEDNSSP